MSWQSGIEKLTDNSQQQLEQFIGHLNAQLDRYQVIPQLVAKNQQLIDLLNDPQSTPRTDIANRFLMEINEIIGASDTYLMNSSGLTLAASNWQKERPFVGRNFSFRPYFIDAVKGNLGRYFALGTTSGKRGYYFSYPIIYAAEVKGVLVVKMNLSNVEKHWAQREIKFIVSDKDEIVFITTQPEWLYNSLSPLSDEARARVLNGQRYGNTTIGLLDYAEEKVLDNGHVIARLGATGKDEYLVIQQAMAEAKWSVRIFAPLKELKIDQRNAEVILLLLISVIILMAYLWLLRHRRQQEKVQFQLQTKKLLEQEVKIRTADLRHEIEEHKHTEGLLKDTQNELIQTAKLALLGQMSASISHELNNPLAAIRSYTDNARQFLGLDKKQQALDNLKRISGLTERMGKISSQLKFFARKSTGSLENLKLDLLIHSAIDIASPQFKAFDVVIETDKVSKNLTLKTDKVQLEQVLINLINNAMYAIGEGKQGCIAIVTQQKKNQTIIEVMDNGPGIEPQAIGKIFDPFFTTRKAGMGLGLSISARIIESLNGTLTATNVAQGGACFTITLQNSEEKSE